MLIQSLPNVIIAGVIKGATSSLYTYLSWHPSICASRRKETNYFLALLQDKSLQPIETYKDYFGHCQKGCFKYLMEATPQYIYGGEVLAKAIYETLGLIKIIFILRDPITRLHSYYHHIRRSDFAGAIGSISFEEYVIIALREFNKIAKSKRFINIYKDNVFIGGIAGGLYADYLSSWYSIFRDSIKVSFFENLKDDPLLVMSEICDWLELDSTIYKNCEFNIENRNIKPKIKLLHQIALITNTRLEIFLRSRYKLKVLLRDMYCFFNESKKSELSLSSSTYKELQSFYEPHNNNLIKMLHLNGHQNVPYWLNRDKNMIV